MSRTRSEYLLRDASAAVINTAAAGLPVRPVVHADRDAVASLLLDAYRGTVDDEGEGPDDARAAVDGWFSIFEWQHSVVREAGDVLAAISFVVVVDGRHYIDPVATMTSLKGRGVGRSVVLASLRSLVSVGVREVGAVITDGNVPSQRLFEGLGFVRIRAWG